MLTLEVSALAEITGGELIAGGSTQMVNSLVIDSRRVEPGVAFVAFPGEIADGHEFLGDAMSRGARALIITRTDAEISSALQEARDRDVAVLRVADALRAVQDLAAFHRSRLFCPVIGITGSTGKTTTKDFLRAVLAEQTRVVATEGNQNNELGVPLTLLKSGADSDVIVVEMAMRGEGQIARLCEIARPTVGLVTNVGTSHIELLGSQEAIASAKGELVRSIDEDGAVFLNADDAFTAALRDEAVAEVITYGVNADADYAADAIELDDESRATFNMVSPSGTHRVRLGVPGRHNVYNALAAASVGDYLEVPMDVVVAGLESAHSGEMRMQVFESASGIHVINDAYNANPTSMRAAIETLAEMKTAGKRIAVLGDMAELGSLTELAHFRIGEDVARLPIDILVTVGTRASRIADGARAEGMDDSCIHPLMTGEEASSTLGDIVVSGDIVLVKASRVMGLECVVEGIVEPRV